jgi:hypothetical protein
MSSGSSVARDSPGEALGREPRIWLAAERARPDVEWNPARAFNLYGYGRAGKQSGDAERQAAQVVPSVTSTVCGAPPSRMKVTLTVVPGA